MIDVACEFCGGLGHFPDRQAGKQGRCPSCGRLIQVPTETEDSVAELAAALRGELDDDDDRVPPPPQLYEPSIEDLVLDSPTKDPFSETDIIPSDQIVEPQVVDHKAARHTARAARRQTPGRPGLDSGRRVATFVAIAVMLILVATVYLILILHRL